MASNLRCLADEAFCDTRQQTSWHLLVPKLTTRHPKIPAQTPSPTSPHSQPTCTSGTSRLSHALGADFHLNYVETETSLPQIPTYLHCRLVEAL
eukprot:1131824-Pelagomonas_calceolata.AAC.1